MKINIDGTVLGTSQLISVPYASANNNVVYVRLADASENPINSVFSVVVFGMPEQRTS